jgi:hypothetical protein
VATAPPIHGAHQYSVYMTDENAHPEYSAPIIRIIDE